MFYLNFLKNFKNTFEFIEFIERCEKELLWRKNKKFFHIF